MESDRVSALHLSGPNPRVEDHGPVLGGDLQGVGHPTPELIEARQVDQRVINRPAHQRQQDPLGEASRVPLIRFTLPEHQEGQSAGMAGSHASHEPAHGRMAQQDHGGHGAKPPTRQENPTQGPLTQQRITPARNQGGHQPLEARQLQPNPTTEGAAPPHPPKRQHQAIQRLAQSLGDPPAPSARRVIT